MQYSAEQLKQIKELASQLMRPDHIALLTGVDPEELKRKIKHKGSEAWKAYETGKAETILELRKQEIKLSRLGSPLAVDMVRRFMVDQEENE